MISNLINNKNRIKDLSRALRTIQSSANTKELYLASLNQTLGFLEAERGSVLIFNVENKELILKISRGQEETLNNFANIKQKIGEGVAGLVAQERKPMLVKDTRKNPYFKKENSRLAHYKTNSFLSAPLFIKDTLIGVINITDKSSGKKFSDADLDYLTMISAQISATFEKIRLSEDLATQKEKTEQLTLSTGELNKELSLAKKFASLGKISSGIAHEINNPLDGIIRYANLCLARVKDDETTKEYLCEIKTGLNRIAEIVRSLLEFSRKESSGKSSIDVHHAIDEALALVNKPNTTNNIIIIKKYFAGAIGAIPDKGIKHAFVNLIKNAYDAMANNGGVLTINTDRKNESIEIKFSDTGCGISEDDKSKIFEPFFTTKSMGKGVGLGLAMCYDIIEKYAGKIHLESCLNKGTSFIITIPLNN